MADQVAQLKSQFAKLMAMGSTFEEDIKVAILLSSLAGHNIYAHLIASVNTLPKNSTTLEYVITIFMDESTRL